MSSSLKLEIVMYLVFAAMAGYLKGCRAAMGAPNGNVSGTLIN